MKNINSLSSLILAVIVFTISIVFYEHEHENKVDDFEQWKQDFGTGFTLGEESYRKLIFYKNFDEIERHNSDSTQTYKKGVNQFTIYTEEEFKLYFLVNGNMMMFSDNVNTDVTYESVTTDTALNDKNIEDIDWSETGISKVKNQGQCSSGWAFSATGAIETMRIIFKKEPKDSVLVSEQHLVDCNKPENKGCNGGWPTNALAYVIKHGIQSEKEYPYIGKDQTCTIEKGSYKISFAYHTIKASCKDLAEGLVKRPLAITVDATNWANYRSGVLSSCGTTLNHAAMLVGIVEGTWKIKNSWSKSWGESGFIRLAGGGSSNICEICTNGGLYVI